MSVSDMLLGTARAVITPAAPTPLAGFVSRRGAAYTEVKQDIVLRAHLFSCAGSVVLFFSADLLWWDPKICAQAKEKIAADIGLAPERILFTATHNHCGPATGDSFSSVLGGYVPKYGDFLLQKLRETAKLAAADTEPVVCTRYDGSCEMNVYRRVKTPVGIAMRPNYAHPADRMLTVLEFRRANGGVKALGVHYACHANLCGDNILMPDYPGLALRILEKRRPGCIAFFWQGCTADLRPNCALGEEFFRCGYDETLRFAEQFAQACERTVHAPGYSIEPGVAVQSCQVSLPLEQPADMPLPEQLVGSKDGSVRAWAKKVLEHGCRREAAVELSRVCLGKGLIVYTFSAEMAQDYAKMIRMKEPGALGVAYTNGMTGYLCTEDQIREGGYEPLESPLYFALYGAFGPEIEQRLHEAIQTLAENGRTEI